MAGEETRGSANVSQQVGIGEVLNPASRILDLFARKLAIEIDPEHVKPFVRETPRNIPGVVGQTPDVVDQHDTGMAARVGRRQIAKFAGLCLHADQYTRASEASVRSDRALNPQNPYAEELRVALTAAREAGALVARHYRDGAESWEKSKGNPVTQADLDADERIREIITRSFPADGHLSEESIDDISRLERSRVWIVDPIDGTREFTKQIPEFAVSIALVVDERPVLGVVHNPIAAVTVSGSLGHGVEKNGQPARLSNCGTLALARVLASRSENDDGKLDPYTPLFGELCPMGSIAWKLALVACGEADFNLSVKPKSEWDVCAGDFLVHEAEGGYVDFAGRVLRYNQRDVVREASMIAGSRALIEEFLERRPKPEPRFA